MFRFPAQPAPELGTRPVRETGIASRKEVGVIEAEAF